MKKILTFALLGLLICNAHAKVECFIIDDDPIELGMADFCIDITETEIASADPMPWAHDGLGCMTDSECEGVDEAE